jgi:hypothetical protein
MARACNVMQLHRQMVGVTSWNVSRRTSFCGPPPSLVTYASEPSCFSIVSSTVARPACTRRLVMAAHDCQQCAINSAQQPAEPPAWCSWQLNVEDTLFQHLNDSAPTCQVWEIGILSGYDVGQPWRLQDFQLTHVPQHICNPAACSHYVLHQSDALHLQAP